jgi:Ca2+-binding RTX toxin-like protein
MTAEGGDADGDELSGFESLSGSDSSDILTGNGGTNQINGRDGDDILIGGGGNDLLFGGNGNDTIDATSGRCTAWGESGNDTIHVDALASSSNNANLPSSPSGGAGVDTIILDNLVSGGSYSLTDLASVTSTMEILDIRNAAATTDLNLASLDVRNFVDGGNASQITIKADSGDSLVIGLVAGETKSEIATAFGIDYTILNASSQQVAQIHWQTA